MKHVLAFDEIGDVRDGLGVGVVEEVTHGWTRGTLDPLPFGDAVISGGSGRIENDEIVQHVDILRLQT